MDDSRRRDSSSEPSWIEGFELFCHRAVNEESIFMNYFLKMFLKCVLFFGALAKISIHRCIIFWLRYSNQIERI